MLQFSATVYLYKSSLIVSLHPTIVPIQNGVSAICVVEALRTGN
jgi:hypothetical protein